MKLRRGHEGTLNAHCYVKEASEKGYILYESNFVTFWKRLNCRKNKKISACQGFRGSGIVGAQGIFRATKLFC